MKKIYKIILLLSPLFWRGVGGEVFSQTAPGIEWQNTIGGNNQDHLHSILQTADGGYILGGVSSSDISGDKTEDNWDTICNPLCTNDYWIVKTDSMGAIQWQNSIGGNNDDVLSSIQQTTDGGYILGGASNSNMSGDKTENSNGMNDYWIVKTDTSGNIQWQNTIGGSSDDVLQSVWQTDDGGYILGGYSRSDISGDKTEDNMGYSNTDDYWIVKTDSLGNIQWQNTIGAMGNDQLYSIEQTTDGGYILGGYSVSNMSGDKSEGSNGGYDYWIIKTNATGNIQWQNTIGGNNYDALNSLLQTDDGGYLIGGFSWSNMSGDKTENSLGQDDYWIVKTDALGNIQWENTIGGSLSDILHAVRQTADGGYCIGGHSNSNISGDKTENSMGSVDYWIVKTNATGIIQWNETIGGSDYDALYDLQQTIDGGYLTAGSSNSNISGDKTENSMGGFDYWIVKLYPDTITGIAQLPQLSNYPITISPNPLTTQSKLTFKNPNKEKFLFTLYDITGRITESISTTNNEVILTKGSKTPDTYREGVYLFNLMNEKTGERWNGKIIITD